MRATAGRPTQPSVREVDAVTVQRPAFGRWRDRSCGLVLDGPTIAFFVGLETVSSVIVFSLVMCRCCRCMVIFFSFLVIYCLSRY